MTIRPMQELRDILDRLAAMGFVRASFTGDPEIRAVLVSFDEEAEIGLAEEVIDGNAEALVAPERN